jgi:hypothetical protein
MAGAEGHEIGVSESQHGFYTLNVAKHTIGDYASDWSSFCAESVLTVEVSGPARKGSGPGDRGQCLAINTVGST